MEAFWQAPRRLRRLLEDGELTPTAYGILNYLGQAGADREEGVATTYDLLASLFEVSERTVRRSFARLRDLELVRQSAGQGRRKPFRVRLGDAALVSDFGHNLGPEQGGSVSEVVAEVTSAPTPDKTSATPETAERRDPASGKGSSGGKTSAMTSAATSVSSPARRDTDTDTEKELEAAGSARGRSRRADPLRDRLAELVYGTTELSTALKRELGVASAELRRQGVELDELEPLVAAYHKRMNGATCSASAIAKWAPALRASTGSPAGVRLERAARLVELQAAELTAAALKEELARFRLAVGDVDKLLRRGAELRDRTGDAA